MSIKFNDTQLVLLSAASQRDDHCLVPPTGPKRSQAQRAVAKLLEAGLVKEIRAKAGAPIWRRDEETGHTYTLKLTAVGVKAIAVDETSPPPGRGGTARRPSGRRGRSTARARPEFPMSSAQRNQDFRGHRTAAAWRWRNSRRACRRNGLAAAHDAGGAHRLAQARLRDRD